MADPPGSDLPVGRVGCLELLCGEFAGAVAEIGADDLGSFDEAALARLVGCVRRAESAIATMLALVGERASALAETGDGPPARELLLADGRWVKGRRAGIEAARAELFALYPEASELQRSARIGVGHVDVLARRLLRLTAEQRNRIDSAELLAWAERVPVDTFARRVGLVVAAVETTPKPNDVDGADGVDDSEEAVADARREASMFRHWFNTDTGMGHFYGSLDPERYEALAAAVDAHTRRLADQAPERTEKNANLAAAALVDLVTSAGETRAGRGSRRQPHVTVVMGPDGAQTGNGYPLGTDALHRLLCDAVTQTVTLDDAGVPINVGRRHRTATANQWTAIRAVHHSCAWHLCDRPLSWCQIHHIHEWENGGSTDLHNLVPLCTDHHHRVHEGGWSLELQPDRSLRITRPNGSHYVTTRPPSRWYSDLASDADPEPQR